jgi:hypothetical protein
MKSLSVSDFFRQFAQLLQIHADLSVIQDGLKMGQAQEARTQEAQGSDSG